MSRLFNYKGGDDTLETAIDKVFAEHDQQGRYDCGDFIVDLATELGYSQIGDLGCPASANDIISMAASIGTELFMSDPAMIKRIVNSGGFVIVGLSSSIGHGHVGVLRHGDWKYSTSWGLDVPMMAHRTLGDPSRSVNFTRISGGFRPGEGVKFYHIGGGNSKSAWQIVRDLDYFSGRR